MRKLTVLICLLFILTCNFSCGNKNENSKNVDSTNVDQTTDAANNPSTDKELTIIAKFVTAGSLEGDADITFQKEDGSNILFYRNYMDPKEPELKYMLIGDDGLSPNPKLVGKTFIVKYKLNPKGRISMVSGEGEPCNQILSLQMK